jgi:hypothetical protein
MSDRSLVVWTVTRMIGGAVLGLIGGGVITLAIIVARARWWHVYLESVDDLVHWQGVPIAVGALTGLLFGWAGWWAFAGSVLGSISGLLAGAGVGATVGALVSSYPESPWAGGILGAAAGLTLGGVAWGIHWWRVHHPPRGGGGAPPLNPTSDDGPRTPGPHVPGLSSR